MNEIHICDVKDYILYIPTEAKIPDGEYILTHGMRCNFSLMTREEFEAAVKKLTDFPDGHKRVLRKIFSRAVTLKISEQKMPLPKSFIENADIKDCAAVEFWK